MTILPVKGVENVLQQFAVSLTNSLLKQDIVKEEDREIYVYGFEAMLSTVVNTVIVIAIGIFAGLLSQTLVFLISFAVLRVFCGGYHAKTHFGCIFTFLVLYGLAMVSAAFIPLQYAAALSCFIGAVSTLFIFKYAPIEHKNRPILDNEFASFHRISRITAVVEFIIVMIISLFFPGLIKFALIIATAMLCVVFIMAFAKIIERMR
ncbi:MAG TPA: hypothetical protein DD738_08950 [Ruminiclostridium sp.]|nr:hypothetical protein [Ruminiclostridium sp.]